MKIKRIHLNNYRAFLVNGDDEISLYTIDIPNGENLLIYGENGSGKSSLFKALKDFFVSAGNTAKAFEKNLFYEVKENSEQPFIDLEIDDGSRHRFSADGNQYVLLQSAPGRNTNYISEANITNGFISYRELLKLHFRHKNEEPDLFSFFLGEEGLFSNMIVPAPANAGNKISFKSLWEKCQRSDPEALIDYNNNVFSLFEELEKKANMLLAFFEKECKLKIEYTEAKPLDNENKNKNSLNGIYIPLVSFKITLFKKEFPGHNDLLNEARLTALAISVFLAHQLCLPKTTLRILFLDDIFIGLDMSNRLPLIEILTADDLGDGSSFKDFQKFMTTYDREWFHVAKTYLDTGWRKIEFYVDGHSGPNERPLIRKTETYRERADYHLTKGDYPASANYLRKAFEQSFRRILPENVQYPGYNNALEDNSIIALSKRQLTYTENDEAWFYKLKNEEDTSIQAFRFMSLQQMINQFKGLVSQYHIPFKLIDELVFIKNRLLNPLSHDDLKSSIFKAELNIGFKILDELEKVTSKVILSIDNSFPIQLYSIQKDNENVTYYYRFELRDNLRLIQYENFRVFVNARLHSYYRTKRHSSFEILEYDYPSLRKICEAIYSFSFPPKSTFTLPENFMFDEVFTMENKSLSELI